MIFLTIDFSPEVTIALRQRLNESTSELEKLRTDLAHLQSTYNGINDELTKAKSDRKSVFLKYPQFFLFF